MTSYTPNPYQQKQLDLLMKEIKDPSQFDPSSLSHEQFELYDNAYSDHYQAHGGKFNADKEPLDGQLFEDCEWDVMNWIMSRGKFTPGPWHEGNTGNHQGMVIAEDGTTVAVTYDKKDARIVSLAPEFYTAAKAVLDNWEHGDLARAVRDLQALVHEADNE